MHASTDAKLYIYAKIEINSAIFNASDFAFLLGFKVVSIFSTSTIDEVFALLF